LSGPITKAPGFAGGYLPITLFKLEKQSARLGGINTATNLAQTINKRYHGELVGVT